MCPFYWLLSCCFSKVQDWKASGFQGYSRAGEKVIVKKNRKLTVPRFNRFSLTGVPHGRPLVNCQSSGKVDFDKSASGCIAFMKDQICRGPHA